MLKATVSGSFHRHMTGIYDAVGELRACGVDVLSPSDPRVVDNIGEFLFVASDRLRSVKLVQDRHLEAIRASDFLLVVCPDGYTGASTSGEILAASVLGVPVVSTSPATDVTIGQYVVPFKTIREAVAVVQARRGRSRLRSRNVLLDPIENLGQAIASLEVLAPLLVERGQGERAERQLAATRRLVGGTFGFSDDQ